MKKTISEACYKELKELGIKEESFSDDKWQRVIELFPERLMRGLYLEGGVKDES